MRRGKRNAMKKAVMLGPIAGLDWSASGGDVIELPAAEIDALIASGQATEYNVDIDALNKKAEEAGAVIFDKTNPEEAPLLAWLTGLGHTVTKAA